jgi:hypothetical protein
MGTYLHLNVDAIIDHVQEQALSVSKCDRPGYLATIVAGDSAIREMFLETHRLWGTNLPYYLAVSKDPRPSGQPLANAVDQILAGAPSEEFLVIAYQDGGLLTVSRKRLPFQDAAASADWWRMT